MIVPFPELRPDQSNNSGVLLVAENCYPALDGYRSVGALGAISAALTGTFNGGFSAISNDGSAYLLAGTESALYRLGAGVWTSLVSAISAPTRWQFAQFKNVVIMVNSDQTRALDLATETVSAVTDAPNGTCVAVIGDFVVIGQADGDVAKVRWSAFNNYTGWTLATDQSGEQPMQNGGVVQGIAGGEYGLIFQRQRIVRMTRTGIADTPFYFDEISNNYGCADGATIATAGRTSFFLSDRGFMAIDDGQALRPIGSEKIDRYFNQIVSRDDYGRIYAAVDPQNKLVIWTVPGSPGKMFIYNFELERWSTASFSINGAFAGFTTSIWLEDLSALYPDLETVPYSFDDPYWEGGSPRLYLLGADNTVGALTGANLPARWDLGFMEFTPGHRARLRKIRPITDATSGVSVTVNSKARLGDADSLTTEATIRPSGVIPIRASGRYNSISTAIGAGEVWNYIQGIDVEAYAGGTR